MSTNFENIVFRTDGDAAQIRLNLPAKGNALNLALIRELTACIRSIDNSRIRTVVIAGEGKHFCSGADLQWMADAASLDYDTNLAEAAELADLFLAIYTSPFLFIASVKGACYGGGIGLAAACDFVVSSDTAEFAFSEVRLGLVPATISPYIIYRLGVQKAKRLMLTGERKKASQLSGSGLIDILSCDENLEEDTFELVRTLALGGRSAQQNIKQLINGFHVAEENLSGLRTKTSEIIARSRVSEEGKEGIRAFLEKRKPNWK